MRQVVQRTHERRRGAPTAAAPGLLCVANFPANTGYAWDFIEGLYAGVGERLRLAGVQTYVFAGCDVLATLQAAHEALRKAP